MVCSVGLGHWDAHSRPPTLSGERGNTLFRVRSSWQGSAKIVSQIRGPKWVLRSLTKSALLLAFISLVPIPHPAGLSVSPGGGQEVMRYRESPERGNHGSSVTSKAGRNSLQGSSKGALLPLPSAIQGNGRCLQGWASRPFSPYTVPLSSWNITQHPGSEALSIIPQPTSSPRPSVKQSLINLV